MGTLSRTRQRESLPFVLYALVSLTAIVWLLFIATRLRPLMDDYIHQGRVIELGILGSTADWFATLLSGFLGVLTISAFSATAVQLPLWLSYVPYVFFLIATFLVLGLVLLKPLLPSRQPLRTTALALTMPPLWFLSVANVFPEYDAINALGMLNWISNGYRVHLPIIFLIAYLIFSAWRPPGVTAPVMALATGLILGFSFLNLLPDLAAYALISFLGALGLWLQRRTRPDGDQQTHQPATSLLALGSGLVLAGIGLAMSPGTSARAERHPLQFSLEAAPNTFLTQVWNFLREMMNVSNILVLIAATAVGLLAAQGLSRAAKRHALQRLIFYLVSLALLLLLLIGSGALGETLTYGAIFHRWSVLQIEFAVFVVMGLMVGYRASDTMKAPVHNLLVAAGLVALLSTFVPLANVTRLADDRLAVWETGAPAPMSYLQDREQQTLNEWWAIVEDYRQTPR